MKNKKRTYNVQRIKINTSYTLQEIATMFGLHINAVRGWLKQGLKPMTNEKPLLIHSSTLIEFLKHKQQSKKRKCQPNEFWCCKCQVQRCSYGNLVDLRVLNKSKLRIVGLCEVCSTTLNRMGAVKKLTEYKKTFDVDTVHQEHILDCADPSTNCYLTEENKTC